MDKIFFIFYGILFNLFAIGCCCLGLFSLGLAIYNFFVGGESFIRLLLFGGLYPFVMIVLAAISIGISKSIERRFRK